VEETISTKKSEGDAIKEQTEAEYSGRPRKGRDELGLGKRVSGGNQIEGLHL